MKHISEFFVRTMSKINRAQRVTARGAGTTKGSHEWRAFNVMQDDVVDAYHVAIPEKAVVIPQADRVLRIVYHPAHQLSKAF